VKKCKNILVLKILFTRRRYAGKDGQFREKAEHSQVQYRNQRWSQHVEMLKPQPYIRVVVESLSQIDH